MNDVLKGRFTKFVNPNSDYKATQLGTLKEVGAGLTFRFQDKNLDKSPTFIFYNPADVNETVLVVLSKKLAALYRAGIVTKKNLPTMTVVEMDLIHPVTKAVIAEKVLRLQAPVSGLQTMDDVVAEDYVDAIAGF